MPIERGKRMTAADMLEYTGYIAPEPGGIMSTYTHGIYGARMAASAFTPLTNKLYLGLIVIPEDMTIARLGVQVSTAAAGLKARVGIFDFNIYDPETSLILDAGVASLDAVAVAYTADVNTDIESGVYWCGLHTAGGGLLFYSHARGYMSSGLTAPVGGVAPTVSTVPTEPFAASYPINWATDGTTNSPIVAVIRG